ncbi:hypothetical protein PGB90_000631 [Kerria lacca]
MSIIKEVIIIGAGVAGIAAATRLFEHGIENILVLEAENRIGGRVNTVDLPNDDGFVEFGAQWIHGEEKNAVFEMAASRNFIRPSHLTLDNMLYVRSSSKIVNLKTSHILYNQFKLIRTNIDKLVLKKCKSSGEYFTCRFLEAFEKMNNDEISSDLQKEFLEWCHQFINSYDGTDSWFNSASSSFHEFWECAGNQYIVWEKGGYRTILSIMMEKCEKITNGNFSKNLIIKNTPVKKISMVDNMIHVECDNDTIYLANHVIITVSLGVLKKKYKKLFEEIPLPEEKILAIENLGIGTVNKIFLKFSHQWWPGDINGIGLLWDPKDKEIYIKQEVGWVTDVFSFCRIDGVPNVLCGWVTGPSSQIMETLDETVVQTYLWEILKKFLGNHYDIPKPEYCIRSTWYSNDHFCGSYSFRSPSSDELGVSSGILSTPLSNKIGDPVVLFAGEATHPHYYSTVHGAVETGWREADRILNFRKMKK